MRDETAPVVRDRIEQLDRLRGIAILGILFMNIPFMGGSVRAIMAGRFDLLGWTGADRVAFFLQNVLADGTARGLLQMLFGAGMVILTTRLAETMRWPGVFRAYYRRYIVLFLFGVAHMFLFLWPGDILSVYAPAALLLFWFRRLGPRLLLLAGLVIGPIFFTIGGAVDYGSARTEAALLAAADDADRAGRPMTSEQRAALADRAAERAKEAKLPAEIATERAGRLAPLPDYNKAMWAEEIELLGYGVHVFWMIEALAAMLVGAALYRWGVLQGSRSQTFYVRLMIAAYAVALTIRIPSVIAQMTPGDQLVPAAIVAEWGRLAMVLGHVCLVALIARTVAGARLLAPFAKAGRIALSLYLLQTLIGMWLLFPGIGLGLWGSMGWAGLMLTAVALTLVQLAIATVYLRHWRTGPIEWLWRKASGALPSTRAPDGAGPPLPA